LNTWRRTYWRYWKRDPMVLSQRLFGNIFINYSKPLSIVTEIMSFIEISNLRIYSSIRINKKEVKNDIGKRMS
jgi:hypothetical protein